jgi:hypothetical protein
MARRKSAMGERLRVCRNAEVKYVVSILYAIPLAGNANPMKSVMSGGNAPAAPPIVEAKPVAWNPRATQRVEPAKVARRAAPMGYA